MHSSMRPNEFPVVPLAELPNLVGQRVHRVGFEAGANWVLKEVDDEGVATLIAKDGTLIFAPPNTITYTRKQYEQAQARSNRTRRHFAR
jgi:hypothetical protein